MAYHEEWVAPQQRWHVVAHNTCRIHAQKKITQKDVKMTNDQVTVKLQQTISYSTLATMIRASRWTQTSMAQWNEMKSIT